MSAACANKEDPALLALLALANGGGSTVQGEIPVEVNISDVMGDPSFIFDTTRSIGIYITVRDPVAPASGSLVQILETSGSATGDVIFQAVVSPEGNIQGSFTVNQTVNQVTLRVTIGGQVYTWLVDISNVEEIRRYLLITAQIQPVTIVDSDQDGIADENDAYPNDATRSAIVRLPTDGYYTVAYEDLFPKQGDADFNDYVVELRYEEDLNAAGKIKNIRGYVRHIARGAGYRHTLQLTLPGVSNATLAMKRFGFDNTTVEAESTSVVPTFEHVEIMPNSGTTIQSDNSKKGQAYKPGKRAEFEVSLATPVAADSLGTMPFDLHLNVINTGHKIHFAGRYFDANGKDLYLDPAGFPWAILVPGTWLWPVETQNTHIAYPAFKTWYESAGTASVDWYLSPLVDKVFQR